MANGNQSGWEKFWQAISFARFAGLIGLLLLAAFVYCIWNSGLQGILAQFDSWFSQAGEVNFARGLITFLFVLATLTIAVALVIFGLFFGNDATFEKRFQLGKEILAIFIGILGTIMGFYFAEDRVATKEIPALNDTVKQSAIGDLEKKGFTALFAKDFDNASQAFADAYKMNPVYHNVGEINKLLTDQKERYATANSKKDTGEKEKIWQDIFCSIYENKRTLGMLPEMIAQVQKNCPTPSANSNTSVANPVANSAPLR